MTTLTKTLCSFCQNQFSLSHAQLSMSDTKTRCGRCQKVCLISKHVIGSSNNHSITSNKTPLYDYTKKGNK